MPRIKLTRKARFKAALSYCDMTQAEWAFQNRVTPVHLSMVLSDIQDRESKALEDKIDAFIAQVEIKVCAQLAKSA